MAETVHPTSTTYRQYALSQISHDFSDKDLEDLKNSDKFDFLEFYKRVSVLESSKYPNALRFDLPAAVIMDLTKELIATDKNLTDQMVAVPNTARTFDNTIGIGFASDIFRGLDSSISFLSQVSPNKAVRDAAHEAAQVYSAYAVEASVRQDVYEALKAFAATEEAKALEGELNRYLERALRDSRRAGLDLQGEQRERMIAIKKRMSELSINFSKNLNDDNTKLYFTKEELEGIPPSLSSRLEEKDGKFEVSLKTPDYMPVMQYCKVESTRKTMATAYNSRARDVNGPIIEELGVLRAELASLLGYPSHAAFVHEVRMAKNPETVTGFLETLSNRLTPSYHKEIDMLTKYKQEEHPGAKLEPWDRAFYSRVYEERELQLDNEKIAEYFPLDKVKEGLFAIYEKLLDVKYVRVNPGSPKLDNPERQLWHDSVELWEMYDAPTGRLMGQFYMDLFPREGKYGHAAVFPLMPGYQKYHFNGLDHPENGFKGEHRDAFGTEERALPVVAIVCNFPAPVPPKDGKEGRPSLLPHSNVVTFFHEFGHAMHGLCSETRLARFAGTSVERDFVEAPSQMLENWVYEPEALRMMSGHYKTGEVLDEATIAQLKKSKESLPAMFNKRQITFGLTDLALHTRKPNDPPVNSSDLYRTMQMRIEEVEPIPGTNFLATFGHIAGGYDAQYYGYLWSEVYALDMYTRFEQEGILNPKTGRDYRYKVIARGSSVDAIDMVRDFLGREPNQTAFLKSKGLEVETQ